MWRTELECAQDTAGRASWFEDDKFLIGGLTFRTVVRDFKSGITTLDEVAILKPRSMIDWYESYFSTHRVDTVLDLGIFQGGSELFILASCPSARLLAIDLSEPVEVVGAVAEQQGWSDRLAMHFNTSQDDASVLRELIADFSGTSPLSLIIDDASHLYLPTKRAFEAAFPYLAPGAHYIIEDWGWANWPGQWQEPDGQWADQPALTNLIFELTMLAASRPDIISHVELVSPEIAVFTRGDGWPYGEPLPLKSVYLNRGREMTLI